MSVKVYKINANIAIATSFQTNEQLQVVRLESTTALSPPAASLVIPRLETSTALGAPADSVVINQIETVTVLGPIVPLELDPVPGSSGTGRRVAIVS